MNELDKIFKRKLEHHHVSVPDDMWSKIESNLYPKEDTRSRYLIGFIAFTVIISAIFGFIYFNNSTPTAHSDIHISPETAAASPTTQSQDIVAIPTENTTQVIPNIQSKNSNTIKIKANSAVDLVSSANSPSPSEPVTPASEQWADPLNTDDVVSLIRGGAVGNSNAEIAATPVRNAVDIAENADHPHTLQNGQWMLPAMTSLNTPSMEIEMDRGSLQMPLFKKVEVKPCPFGEADKFRRIDVYFSPEYAIRQFQSDAGAENYLKMRRNTESPNLSYSLGVRLGYSIGYRWNLMAGLNFTKINESFEYVDPESISTRIIITKDYTIVNGVKVDSVVREEVVEIPGTEKMYINNTYKTLDLPIMARYIIAAPGKYSISAIGGAMVNLAFTTKGKIISPYTNNPDDITTGTPFAQNTFKTNIGATLIGGFSFAYFLSPSVDVLLEPTVKFQPTFLNYAEFPVRQRYINVGLAAGFRFRF